MQGLYPEIQKSEPVETTSNLDEVSDEAHVDYSGVQYVSPLDDPNLMEQHERLMAALADNEVSISGDQRGQWY